MSWLLDFTTRTRRWYTPDEHLFVKEAELGLLRVNIASRPAATSPVCRGSCCSVFVIDLLLATFTVHVRIVSMHQLFTCSPLHVLAVHVLASFHTPRVQVMFVSMYQQLMCHLFTCNHQPSACLFHCTLQPTRYCLHVQYPTCHLFVYMYQLHVVLFTCVSCLRIVCLYVHQLIPRPLDGFS